MSKMEATEQPRRREDDKLVRGVNLTTGELIAGIGLLVAIMSSLNGWFVLPEQVKSVRDENARQDVRIQAIEDVAQEKAEILARIDERTRRIEEVLRTKFP